MVSDLSSQAPAAFEFGGDADAGSVFATAAPVATPVLTATAPFVSRLELGVKPTATVTVTRSGDLSRPLVLPVKVTGGTAQAGFDYRRIPLEQTKVRFAAGASTAYLAVPLVATKTIQREETIQLRIGPARGARPSVSTSVTLGSSILLGKSQSVLLPGERLLYGTKMSSPNGTYHLEVVRPVGTNDTYQVLFYKEGAWIWKSATFTRNVRPFDYVEMLANGELGLVSDFAAQGGGRKWWDVLFSFDHRSTADARRSFGPLCLELTDDGRMQVKSSHGNVVWENGRYLYSPWQPPAEWSTASGTWYESHPAVRATGAPLRNFRHRGADDGIQGMIKNESGQRVLVETRISDTSTKQSRAILEPGDSLPYQLSSAGTLKFYKFENGNWVGPVQYYLEDPLAFRPETKFYPANQYTPASQRTNWKEGDSHYEIWGGTKLFVKRENNGWTVPAPEAYVEKYGNPNDSRMSDWAIFTINIQGL